MPGTEVPPLRIVIDQPVAWISSENVIWGATSSLTPVALRQSVLHGHHDRVLLEDHVDPEFVAFQDMGRAEEPLP